MDPCNELYEQVKVFIRLVRLTVQILLDSFSSLKHRVSVFPHSVVSFAVKRTSDTELTKTMFPPCRQEFLAGYISFGAMHARAIPAAGSGNATCK